VLLEAIDDEDRAFNALHAMPLPFLCISDLDPAAGRCLRAREFVNDPKVLRVSAALAFPKLLCSGRVFVFVGAPPTVNTNGPHEWGFPSSSLAFRGACGPAWALRDAKRLDVKSLTRALDA
jgi:hypothetical protein